MIYRVDQFERHRTQIYLFFQKILEGKLCPRSVIVTAGSLSQSFFFFESIPPAPAQTTDI